MRSAPTGNAPDFRDPDRPDTALCRIGVAIEEVRIILRVVPHPDGAGPSRL